jgi:hypothetical protein
MIIKALASLLICAGSVQIMPQTKGNHIDAVEQWRPLAQQALDDYGIPEQIETFLRVMHCESRGDPWAKNPNSTASGLMQHLARPYWPARAAAIGMPNASVFDPIANVYASAYLLTTPGGGWGHWTCY